VQNSRQSLTRVLKQRRRTESRVRNVKAEGAHPSRVLAARRGRSIGMHPKPLRPSSPDDDGDRPRERGDHKAEVDPGPISLSGPGRHKKMDHDPQAQRESESKPNQIARGFVD
jgi:hypothetical protein